MDPEVTAMSSVALALEPLDVPARTRVLRWAVDRFRSYSDNDVKEPPIEGLAPPILNGSTVNTNFETLAELFSAANPSTGPERALVVGYWIQEIESRPELTSFEVNKELKDLGHGSKRINGDFDSLMGSKPQLALQLKKSGKSKQARKKYKITQAGIARVAALIKGDE